MKNNFLLLSGTHGARYIFNTSHWSSIKESLKFYRAYTLKGKFQKRILAYVLFVLGKFFPSNCKSKDAIKIYLKENINADVDFNLDEKSSVLISPTRDKVIVNHHGQYFHKFAFGKSFKKVKNESSIYNLLQHSQEFQVASLKELHTNERDTTCYFKLLNPPVNQNDQIKVIDNLPVILVEFFNSGTIKKTVKLSYYIDNLLKRFNSLKMEPTNNLTRYFEKTQEEHNTETMPLGLVHRDFKPWNTLLNSKLLIFDFEETVTDGPPLEDLLNYYIDPVILYQSPLQVYDLIFSEIKIAAYKAYLILLNINVQFELFIVTYMVERIIFWTLADNPFTAKFYQNLLNHILLNSKQ